MNGAVTEFIVGGISLSVSDSEENAVEKASAELGRAGINPARLHLSIYKKSVDARKKNDVRIVYSVAVRSDAPVSQKRLERLKYSVSRMNTEEPDVAFGSEAVKYPPLVVGMGPAGLFCALMLAENGYRPIIIDRGDGIAERCKKTEIFFRQGILDCESNIQFGAGGAGTFSDGKLVTRVGDARLNYILRRFCDFGAPKDILTSAKPHIGTDLLVGIVDRMLGRIAELGGRVIYRCRLVNTEYIPDGIKAETTLGEIACSCVVLATGHSAYDVYENLINKGYAVEPKPFSVGVRIEHLQADIDRAMYGRFAGHPRLGAAEYHLSDTSTGRGVYTFCMCPGGEVVAASSDAESIVVNGMSRRARDGKNANSAVLVTVRPEDIGGGPREAIDFGRKIERLAYKVGGGDYYAPAQTVGSFLSETEKNEPKDIMPTYRGGKVKMTDIASVLPKFVTDELALGLRAFDKKINGFARADALLTGVETRSSAPIRILRGEQLCALGHDRIYPCGEGAGYAGGISSAALDGVKVALAYMARSAKPKE